MASRQAPRLGTHIGAPLSEGEEVDRRYAMYFAMVDYVLLGHLAGGVDRRGQVADYLVLLDQGSDEPSAFQRAFGMPQPAFEEEVLRYLRKDSLPVVTIEVAASAPTSAGRATPAAATAIACALGDVALMWKNPDDALALFELARETDPQRGCATIGATRALLEQGKADSVRGLLEARLAGNPRDAGAHVAYAEYLLYPSSPSGKPPADIARAKLDSAREHLRTALEIDRHDVLAEWRLAGSYLVGGEDVHPALDAVGRVIATGTALPAVYLTAGALRIQADDWLGAERYLSSALRMDGGDEVSAEASAFLDLLSRRTIQWR